MRKVFISMAVLLTVSTSSWSQIIVDFEEINLEPDRYLDGFSSTLGVFASDLSINGTVFHNTYSRNDWGYGLTESFSGFAYSKVTDNTTPGYVNQYSCIAGSGANGSSVYGVYYASAAQVIDFEEQRTPTSVSFCNSTYAYRSMLEGDAFAKKFGGDNGTDPDYFFIRIVGISAGNRIDSTDFYLADFRFEDSTQDYLIDEWTAVDLSSFGEINSLELTLYSSDLGDWGMNTPAYFCIDNVNDITFENQTFTSGEYWNGSAAALKSFDSQISSGPATLSQVYTLADWGYGMTGSFTGWAVSNVVDSETPGFSNQFAAIPGSGAANSANYALCYNSRGADTIALNNPLYVSSLDLTNGTYPYLSMKNGDAFAKKFGGETGNDPDYFLVTISGYQDGQETGTIDFYLADYRFEDNAQDYILNEWTTADLSALGQVDQLVFSLSSSDNGDWGMNTPAYFFVDNLVLSQTSQIDQFSADNSIHIYPNPAVNYVSIESDQPIDHFTIYSLIGQQLYDSHPENQESKSTIDISKLRKGHYIIRIQSNGKEISKKIIKN